MLLRSGYNTEFACGADIMRWSPNFMTPWKKGEFKKEVREMRERLKKIVLVEELIALVPKVIKKEEIEEEYERRILEDKRRMTKADWIKYHSEELLEGLIQAGKYQRESGCL